MIPYRSSILAYVLKDLGLNCEQETKMALQSVGARVEFLSLFELKNNPKRLLQAQLLAIPGGFSFGDEVATGVLAAQYIRTYAQSEWDELIRKQTPIIGICNGHQILCQLNAFSQYGSCAKMPNGESNLQSIPDFVLAENPSGVFCSEWKQMQLSVTAGPWLHGLSKSQRFWLPVRHKAGRLLASDSVWEESQAVNAISYVENWNGSLGNSAALINRHGNIIGLMPHPEGAMHMWQLPEPIQKECNLHNTLPFGQQLFKNVLENL